MKRHFYRAGPWLFMAALAWYLLGNYLANDWNKKNLAQAKSVHHDVESFSTSTVTRVVIRGVTENNGDYFGKEVSVVFSPDFAQAKVASEDLEVLVSGQQVAGVLTLSLQKVAARRDPGSKDLTIYLPSSIHDVAFSDISAVTASGYFSAQANDLALVVVDDKSKVTLKKLVVNHLNLTAIHTPLPEKTYRNLAFSLKDDVVVNALDVSMLEGEFTFSANMIPQHIQLNLGDAVTVTAPRAFLQGAQFNKLP